MLIYTCMACQAGEHEDCNGIVSPPPGVYGGSKCNCNCSLTKEKKPINYRFLAIDFEAIVREANEAVWNCFELSHGKSEINEAKLHGAINSIKYNLDHINRILGKP